jgi:acyl-CoA dehydrogenase
MDFALSDDQTAIRDAVKKLAARFDAEYWRRRDAGGEFPVEACFRACETAVMTLGGMGYAKEYDVERYLRESFIARIAPVSPYMILNFIAEKALGLPKSY